MQEHYNNIVIIFAIKLAYPEMRKLLHTYVHTSLIVLYFLIIFLSHVKNYQQKIVTRI